MTPKIRTDLRATPTEDQGIRYFDVADPRSGSRMRLYDFEWLVATRMDGSRHFNDVAEWAKLELGIQPSSHDLEEYAHRLRELGFFQVDSPEQLAATAPHAALTDDITPLPEAAPSDDRRDYSEPEIEVETPTITDMPSLGEQERVRASGRADASTERNEKATVPTMAAAAPLTADEIDEPPTNARGPTTGRMTPVPTPKRSGVSGSLIVILILLLLGGAGLVYYKFFMPPAPAKVTVQVVSPREVVHLYDGAGTVKKADATTLTFGEGGKVAMVVEKGARVKADEPVAKLESFDNIEKALIDVRDRLGFYEKQRAAAAAKGDDGAVRTAESKVNEKRKLLGELEAKAHKARLTAPAAGKAIDVMVKPGDDVKPGAPAVKLADERMTVEFKLPPADVATFKTGARTLVKPTAAGPTLAGQVVRVEGGGVTVELGDDAPAKAGDSLRLVKARIPNVVPVPLTAVVKRDGADTVFVLSEGKALARRITISDRTVTEALVASGLSAGDSVITTGADQLQDGQPASTQ